MPNPWEEYADKPAEASPWEEYQTPIEQKKIPASAYPGYRAGLADFIRKTGKRSTKQEAVRGLPMGNTIADATLGTYNNPVHPEQTVDQLLGPETKGKYIPSASARGVGKFLTNPAPQIEGAISALPRLVKSGYEAITSPEEGSIGKFVGNTAKGLTAPFGGADIANVIGGEQDASTLNPFSEGGLPQARNAWENDLLGSALAGEGFLKGVPKLAQFAKKGTGALVGKALNALPDGLVSPEGLAKSALKPYIGDMKARNAATNRGIETFLTDKNATPSPKTFLDKNVAEMEEIVGRQNMLLDDKGHTRAEISPIENSLNDFINESRSTPGTAESSVQAAQKVLDDIKNHPDYDAATNTIGTSTAQTMKKNIWRYLKEKGAFSKDANPVLNDAMWSSADGMAKMVNDVIPEMAGENARYGEIANLNKMLTRSVNRIANNNIISLHSAMQLVRGDVKGLLMAAAMKTIDHPTFKSYLAQQMAKARGTKPTSFELKNAIANIKKNLTTQNLKTGIKENVGNAALASQPAALNQQNNDPLGLRQ